MKKLTFIFALLAMPSLAIPLDYFLLKIPETNATAVITNKAGVVISAMTGGKYKPAKVQKMFVAYYQYAADTNSKCIVFYDSVQNLIGERHASQAFIDTWKTNITLDTVGFVITNAPEAALEALGIEPDPAKTGE